MVRLSLRKTLEVLERRDTPAATGEEVFSLPDLPGMSDHYPTDEIVQTVSAPSRVGVPLLAEPRPRYAVASAAGRPTTVQVYDGPTNALLGIVTPFDAAFTGGANVTTADITGDGVDDLIVAPAGNHAPEVRVFDGRTLAPVRAFLAYTADFTGGLFLAAGDVDGDGRADIVTGAGAAGGPHVNVFSGRAVAASAGGDVPADQSFYAYEPEFLGGVTVAVADVDADGYADLVTGAGPGGGPRVRVLSGADGSTLADYFAFDPASRTGVAVAAADFGAGRAQVAVTPLSGGSQVRLYDAGTQTAVYEPFGPAGRVGSLAARDFDRDGAAELVAGSAAGAAPRVVVLDGRTRTPRRDLPALTPDYTDGLRVG